MAGKATIKQPTANRQTKGKRKPSAVKGATLQPVVVPISTLAPEPFRLKRDIPVLLRPNGEDFIASFLDANVNASGQTQAEALDNLKDMLTTLFRKLRSLPAKVLGPGPSRQLAVLNEFIEAR